VHEATGEGQEPDEREKDGQRSDGLGVDEAGFSPGVVAQGLVGVKPFTGEADDDCCKCELADAEQHGEDRISEWCHCGWLLCSSKVVVMLLLLSCLQEGRAESAC